MGWDTFSFEGKFDFNKPVEPWLRDYVNAWSETRHMMRDNKKIKKIYPNWKELCYQGELGTNGEFFIGGEDGAFKDESILHNNNSGSVPSLNCDWYISGDGMQLLPKEADRNYGYIYMLSYMIKKFFKPNDLVLNGEVSYCDAYDSGVITVKDNKVSYTGQATGNDYWPTASENVLKKYRAKHNFIFIPNHFEEFCEGNCNRFSLKWYMLKMAKEIKTVDGAEIMPKWVDDPDSDWISCEYERNFKNDQGNEVKILYSVDINNNCVLWCGGVFNLYGLSDDQISKCSRFLELIKEKDDTYEDYIFSICDEDSYTAISGSRVYMSDIREEGNYCCWEDDTEKYFKGFILDKFQLTHWDGMFLHHVFSKPQKDVKRFYNSLMNVINGVCTPEEEAGAFTGTDEAYRYENDGKNALF